MKYKILRIVLFGLLSELENTVNAVGSNLSDLPRETMTIWVNDEGDEFKGIMLPSLNPNYHPILKEDPNGRPAALLPLYQLLEDWKSRFENSGY